MRLSDLPADFRTDIYSARIADSIGATLGREMAKRGTPSDVIAGEVIEACHYAGLVLDRITRAAREAESGDDDGAQLLLGAAGHFRGCMLRRLPGDLDIRTIPGDVPEGVEIIRRGESWDRRD